MAVRPPKLSALLERCYLGHFSCTSSLLDSLLFSLFRIFHGAPTCPLFFSLSKDSSCPILTSKNPNYSAKKQKHVSSCPGNWTVLLESPGEGNGTPLQYSCLENCMDGGAWWAAVHGIGKSRTWLNDFTFTFHFYALEKELATHSSVLAWRIPGMGSHRVWHDSSDLAVAVAVRITTSQSEMDHFLFITLPLLSCLLMAPLFNNWHQQSPWTFPDV